MTVRLLLLLIFFSAAFSTVLAQPPRPVTTLGRAVTKSIDLDADVIAARTALATAERAAARAKADPFALRLPKVQAEYALEDARTDLRNARLAARAETQAAYFEALAAADAVRLAEREQALTQTMLGATQIRFEAGAVTVVEVDRARNAERTTTRTLNAARTRRTLALGQLAGRLGVSAAGLTLRGPKLNPALPELNVMLQQLGENSELIKAKHTLEEARLYLAGLDNAFSAKVELESARAAYQGAQSGLAELRRSLEQSVRAAYTTAEALQDALRAAQEGNTTEQMALKVQQARFEAGSASRVELLQAEIDAAKSAALVRTARYDLAKATLALEETVWGAAGSGSTPLSPSIFVPNVGGSEGKK